MTPTQFNSEYEILNWLSRHQNFAQGVAELRTACANRQLTSGHGLVEKWLSVYDDVTTGRVVTHDAVDASPRPSPSPSLQTAPAPTTGSEAAARRTDALDAHSIVHESQLWAEASREAASRADLVASRVRAPVKRAGRWGKLGFVLGLLALMLVLAQSWLLWPQIEARLRSLQPGTQLR